MSEISIISVQIGSATVGLVVDFWKRKVSSFICFVGCLRAVNSTFSVNVFGIESLVGFEFDFLS